MKEREKSLDKQTFKEELQKKVIIIKEEEELMNVPVSIKWNNNRSLMSMEWKMSIRERERELLSLIRGLIINN